MNNKYTNLILAISAMALIVSISFFVYFLNIIKNKNKHTSAVTSTLENKIKEKENIKILEAKMSELEDINNKIGSYVVETSRIDTFVEYLEGLEDSNNIDVLVRGVDIPKNEMNKIIVTVNITGTFSNVMKGVAILENSPYNIIINSLYINKDITKTSSVSDTSLNEKNTVASNDPLWVANLSFSALSL